MWPVLLVLALLGAGWWYARVREPNRPELNRPAPQFELKTLDGATLSLNDQRGRPVILNFWATWCEPCKEEMPALQAAAARHPELRVLAIDDPEPVEKTRAFIAQ